MPMRSMPAKQLQLFSCIDSRTSVEPEEHCNCDPTQGQICADEDGCINRMLNIECPESCQCGKECRNQRIRRREYPYTEIVQTELKGLGVVAGHAMQPDVLVAEYVGDVLPQAEADLRMSQRNSKMTYMLSLGNGFVIDASRIGNVSRFINHSCEPNCRVEFWQVSGRVAAAVMTKQPVMQGEELTFDYKLDSHVHGECFCGASSCRGTLGRSSGSGLTEGVTGMSDRSVAGPVIQTMPATLCTGCGQQFSASELVTHMSICSLAPQDWDKFECNASELYDAMNAEPLD